MLIALGFAALVGAVLAALVMLVSAFGIGFFGS
jgi:hypothetical protein